MLEKMVAEMLGISPQEMTELIGGMQDMLKNTSATLLEIKAQNEKIISLLSAQNGAKENEHGNDDN